MPIYEYECSTCGHRFEKMVRIGADMPPCPSCEATAVRKLISASQFILKGGGWYKDHYGLKGESSKGEGAKGESGKPEAAKSDAKAADSKAGESKAGESKAEAPKKTESKPSTPATAAK